MPHSLYIKHRCLRISSLFNRSRSEVNKVKRVVEECGGRIDLWFRDKLQSGHYCEHIRYDWTEQLFIICLSAVDTIINKRLWRVPPHELVPYEPIWRQWELVWKQFGVLFFLKKIVNRHQNVGKPTFCCDPAWRISTCATMSYSQSVQSNKCVQHILCKGADVKYAATAFATVINFIKSYFILFLICRQVRHSYPSNRLLIRGKKVIRNTCVAAVVKTRSLNLICFWMI